jgi:hypothetical protein
MAMSQNFPTDPTALGFTIMSLSIALEEALKALAGKNGNTAGPWLDEVQDLALLRARAIVGERATFPQDTDAMAASLAVAEFIFTKIRNGLSS